MHTACTRPVIECPAKEGSDLQIFEHVWALAAPHLLHVWAVVGPLVGILLGGRLTTKNQRKPWLLDNKRGEYRKLLTALSDCGAHFILAYGAGRTLREGRQQRLLQDAARKLADVVSDRPFIADGVRDRSVSDRFTKAVNALKESHDGKAFGKDVDAIMDDIRQVALRDFS